jgi:hypothetical protein
MTMSTDRARWVALAVVCTAALMNVLDTTITGVALPEIRRDLGFSQAALTGRSKGPPPAPADEQVTALRNIDRQARSPGRPALPLQRPLVSRRARRAASPTARRAY